MGQRSSQNSVVEEARGYLRENFAAVEKDGQRLMKADDPLHALSLKLQLPKQHVTAMIDGINSLEFGQLKLSRPLTSAVLSDNGYCFRRSNPEGTHAGNLRYFSSSTSSIFAVSSG